jgi:hypothetical protein
MPAKKKKDKQWFFLQNREIGYVGNCMQWWMKDAAGYTCDINEAELLTKEEADKLVEKGMGKYVAWPVEEINKHSVVHVDMQYPDSTKSVHYVPKKEYRIASSWLVSGTHVVKAHSFEEAKDLVYTMELPEGEYVDGSWEIDDDTTDMLNEGVDDEL